MSEANTKALSKKDEATALAAYTYVASESHDELGKDSYAIPRIAIIEALSPELEKTDPEYNPDAEKGALSNRVMGEIYKDGILAIPVKRRDVYLEWTPRKQGGGFIAEHNLVEGAALMKMCERNENNVDMTPSGTELHSTLEFYILYSVDAGDTWAPAIISMSRTRRAEGKKWNMRISQFKQAGQHIDPLAQVYAITTASRPNGEGQVSYVFKTGTCTFLPEAVTDHTAVFAQAKGFLDAIDSGTAQVNRDDEAAVVADAVVGEEF